MDRQPFSALLAQHRQAARLTQEQLAAAARVGVRTVRDLEAGRAQRPQRSTVELLAQALQLSGHALAEFFAAARGRPTPVVSVPAVEALIGREEDVAAVASLLRVADLVTVTGLAGVGKATLAAAAAHEVVANFPGGIGAIRITEASTESELLTSAASVLGAAVPEELSVRAARERALLVVVGTDRCPAAARAAVTWLRDRARLAVLATGRHPLSLPGEHQWALGPLEVPPETANGASVLDYPAVRLFLDRLRRVRTSPVTVADAATVAALVRRLGGLPLALEIAAARGRVLDLAEMLARIGESPDRAAPTVRAAVLGSWDLLTPPEQASLCWLSVFQWRWSVELAEELLAGCDPAPGDIVALVDRLVALGFVRVRAAPRPPVLRCNLFPAVRQVALEQARARGVLPLAQDRHAEVIAGVCLRAAGDHDEEAVVRAYLVADVQAAADHLVATGEVSGEAHRELARWLS